jgi:hypothetical protein
MDEDDSGEWGDFDTGPFCQHWSDPSDCDELCVCGHKCHNHWMGDYCRVDDCNCEKFKDIED